MSEPPAETSSRYDLFTRDGNARFVWRLTDRGTALEPHSIVFMRAGRWTRVPFADIASIGLSRQGIGRVQLAQCLITLRNGRRIVISNANARGVNDGRHDGPFRLFVDELHKALRANGAAGKISFVSGFTTARMNGLIVISIIASVFFIALPIVLVAATRDLKALWALLFGIAFMVPVWTIVRVNQPGRYDPANPPDMVA